MNKKIVCFIYLDGCNEVSNVDLVEVESKGEYLVQNTTPYDEGM